MDLINLQWDTKPQKKNSEEKLQGFSSYLPENKFSYLLAFVLRIIETTIEFAYFWYSFT